MVSSTQRNARLTALCFAAAFLIPSLTEAAQGKILHLKNGAQLRGDIIKETSEALFFDLGFDVVPIPLKRVDRVEDIAPENATTADIQKTTASADSLYLTERRRYNSLTTMLDESKRSVVIVSNPGGFGAGFIVNKQGRVVTNHHVVKDQRYHAVTLLIKGDDGVMRRKKIEDVELIAFSRLLDIALLQLPEDKIADLDLSPLPLGFYESVDVGDPVYAIGNPGMGHQMLDHSVSQGIVSSSNRNINDVLYMQTTAAVNPGNSGGPLVDDRGQVIGLVTLKAIFQENIAFALPVSYIKLFLRNEKAFAFDKSNPNRSYRYVNPDRQ